MHNMYQASLPIAFVYVEKKERDARDFLETYGIWKCRVSDWAATDRPAEGMNSSSDPHPLQIA